MTISVPIESAVGPGRQLPVRSVSPKPGHGSNVITHQLTPPCNFVRGVDSVALQNFREGNMLYRMGFHKGSKGELAALASPKKGAAGAAAHEGSPPHTRTPSPPATGEAYPVHVS